MNRRQTGHLVARMMCHPGHHADGHRTVDGPVAMKRFFRSLSSDARPLKHPRWEQRSLKGLIVIRVLTVFMLGFVVVHQIPQHVIPGLRRALKLFPNPPFEIAGGWESPRPHQGQRALP